MKKESGEATVKMVFSEQKFYNDLNVPLYDANKVYDVPLSMRDRWIKRGGQVLSEKEAEAFEKAKAEVAAAEPSGHPEPPAEDAPHAEGEEHPHKRIGNKGGHGSKKKKSE